jgi:hypothetical protein
MSRTALTVTAATTRDTGYAIGAGVTPDATNGNIVAGPIGAWHLGILVYNADSSNHTLILRAGGYAGAATGAANSGYVTDQYQPFAQASVGDLSVTCLHTGGGYTVIEALTTDRFAQSDGSLWLDWSASTSMTVWCWQKAYMP